MALKSSRVVSSSSCPVTTTAPVTISCPAPTAVIPTAVSPAAVFPTEVLPIAVPTKGVDVNALLDQLGLCPTAEAISPVGVPICPPGKVFKNPLCQLDGLNPFAALAANNLLAALAALSPALGIFNQAIDPKAGLLAFNPACAPTQALASKQCPPTLPFGKFCKWPFGI